MTMTTTVRINAPIPPRKALDFITALVGGEGMTDEQLRREERASWSDDGTMTLSNGLGLGLKAWCGVHYYPDGPLPGRNKYFEEDEESWPDAIIALSFDTAYGYVDENGRGCGDLHRAMLVKIEEWLSDQGVNTATHAWWYAGEYVSDYQPLNDLSEHQE